MSDHAVPAVTQLRKNHVLWYEKPAASWVEALPIGNGRLGAMVFGGVAEEKLALNEDTLWSGGPNEHRVPGAVKHLAEVRKLIFEGKSAEAEELLARTAVPQSPGSMPREEGSKNFALAGQLQSYLPLGDLRLIFADGDGADEYRRELDLDTAIARVNYRKSGKSFTREAFASHPDNVIVVRVASDSPGGLNFEVVLDSPHAMAKTVASDGGRLRMAGRVSPRRRPSKPPFGSECDADWYEIGMGFEAGLEARVTGGECIVAGDRLRVRNADEAVLVLTAATSFVDWTNANGDPAPQVEKTLAAVRGKSFAELRAAHVEDHQRLYRRVSLTLDETPNSALPTDRRIERAGEGAEDPALAALFFDVGRYLLIASSRPGTLPATLQGIWNDLLWPPWGSKWTININTQMNFWPAEVCNLPECHETLFDLIESLLESGRKTAHEHYGCEGFVAHHNTDIWRATGPVDNAIHVWPMGGAWLCLHLWEHYAYTRDREFLEKRAYPMLKEASRFIAEFLIEAPEGTAMPGMLVTNPSMSPENHYRRPDGTTGFLTYAATMDLGIIRELLEDTVRAASELGVDPGWQERLREIMRRLPPFQIGRHGQIQEWIVDMDDPNDHHRHNSHLFGVYPGSQITHVCSPDLANAAARSLDLRGDGGTGWSLAWKVALWARLRDGNRAHRLLTRFLTPAALDEANYEDGGGVYANLFGAHPPFQIDCNFGATAGIAEILLQSHAGEIELLPSLPAAWPNGEVRGLRARGALTVDFGWKGCRLTWARVTADRETRCAIRYGEVVRKVELAAGEMVEFGAELG